MHAPRPPVSLLPRVAAEHWQVDSVDAAIPEPGGASGRGRWAPAPAVAPARLTVLLVEDNPGDARLIREALPREDFDVVHVTTLAEGTRRLSEGDIDAILLDLSLPDGGGVDTISWVLVSAPQTPVVVLTGLDDEEVALQALRCGVQDYLVKGRHDDGALTRTVLHAIEREHLVTGLDALRQSQIESKDQLLSHVSHELRTPLNAVYQFISIVLDEIGGPLAAEQREYLSIAFRNVEQLRTMIGDLLDVTRLDAGTIAIVPTRAMVASLVDETAATMASAAEAKHLTLTTDVAASLPAVCVDPQRLRQVLTNLVDNAIKFTPGGGRISVSAALDPDAGDFVRLTVADTGPGVAAVNRERIFERFQQETASVETSRKGLGLGLYICRELVTRQGGRIWVEGDPGAGSRFCFTAPVWLEDDRFPLHGENGSP